MLGVSQTQVAADGHEGDQQPADHRGPQLYLAAKVSTTMRTIGLNY